MTGEIRTKGHIWLFPFEGQNNGGTAYLQARDGSNTRIGLTIRVQDNATIRNAIYIFPSSDIYLNYDNVGYSYMRGSLLQTSDASVKENIKPLIKTKEKLMQLIAVSYNYKETATEAVKTTRDRH